MARRVGGDLLPTFVTTADVKAVQGAVNADFTSIRTALIKCTDAGTFSDTKTPGDWNAWQNLKGRVLDYLKEEPSWLNTKSQVDRGQLLQRELATWHDKVKALGCDAGAAPMLPTNDFPALFAGTSLGVIAVLALLYFMGGKR